MFLAERPPPWERRWNLNSLSGGVEDNCHPPYTIGTLVAAALNGAPQGILTSKEVRLAIIIRYNFFLTRGFEWHALVDNTLENSRSHFPKYHRKDMPDDTGEFYGLEFPVFDFNCSRYLVHDDPVARALFYGVRPKKVYHSNGLVGSMD
ncbi:hypothetical protein Clacol_003360 [Clathrus columnatus]|uniref:Uncharacterized protein n=1 Tax=Clathrus columnatus TaxID=1419009 RepID=A0AAV5A6N5_9AGAM|nr:hypothetical protein Clacol_003360 [Clathrus columnatus]